MADVIRVEGIETNNLRGLDVELEKRALNLIIGPSGSGKSSLAYDTIAQIGQHEYMAMFADDVAEPSYKVKGYHNMVVAVPIRQSNSNNNMHSTIGTYFGLNRSIAFIFASMTGIPEEHFTLNRAANLCENCHGLGFISVIDENRIIDYSLPISQNPFRCWNKFKDFYRQILVAYCHDVGIDPSKTFRQLSEKEKHLLLYGEGKTKYKFLYKRTNGTSQRTSCYYGIMTGKAMMPDYSTASRFYSERTCPCCGGQKYGAEQRQYLFNGLSIGDFMTMPFAELINFVEESKKKVKDVRISFAFNSLHSFLKKANDLNLGHLFFHRAIPTLSGGELQRLRMVQVFNAQLSDMLVVLDEPLAGLSGREKKAIYENIIALCDRHTVLVVDHSDVFVSKARRIYALGPGGGSKGGQMIDAAQYIQQESQSRSLSVFKTDAMLPIEVSSPVYQYQGTRIAIMQSAMNMITGPSGVGKSTLLREYFPQVFDEYLYINQKPMMGNKTSSVITALDLFGRIQDLFAKKTGKDRRWFSNQSGCDGACPVCGGAGYIEYGYDARTKSILPCEECEGTGFNKVLKKYKIDGKTIFDIWNMTIDEGIQYFRKLDSKISTTFEEASSILLGHLKIGQPTSTLSGGENIRIKIMKAAKSTAKVLGIDEPFKGLSPSEIYLVASFFDRIRAKGKTIVVVDHSEEAERYFGHRIVLAQKDGILIESRRQI